MTVAAEEKREVTLPGGVHWRRVAQGLLDAWEADSHRWMNAPRQLREGALLEKYILPADLKELKKIVSEEQQRIAKAECDIQS